MAENVRELRGLGGWLAVFLVLLGLVTAVQTYSLYQAITHWLARQHTALALPLPIAFEGWLIAATRIAIGLAMLRQMIHVRRWSSVRLCITGLWVYYVGLTLVDALAAAAIVALWLGMELHPDFWLVGSALSKGCLIAFSGTWYLLRSRRVANTYERPTETEVLREVFG